MHPVMDAKMPFPRTLESDKRKLRRLQTHGKPSKCRKYAEVVCSTVSSAQRNISTVSNGRADKAIESANDVSHAPVQATRKLNAVIAKTLPTAAHGTQWMRPALAFEARLCSHIVRCIWCATSLLRCLDFV